MQHNSRCLYCNKLLPISTPGHRACQYCNDACRKAASRRRKAMTHAITLQQQWNILPAAARERLETIQDRYGPEAAQLATEAIREVFTESLTQVFRIAHTFRFCKQS